MKGKLILTVEQAEKDHDLWLKVRNEGLGGSEVAAIMGYSKYNSAYSLWAEKTGQVEPEDLSENEYVYWGTKNEPNIADRFEEVTGKKVRRCGTLQDEEYPFFHANVDRLVVGENAGLEIKTAGLTKSNEWRDDEVPDDYYCQCQWYMGISGAEKWYIAVLIGGNKMVWKEIARNDDTIKGLREAALNFWQNNVLGGVAPETDGNEGTTNTIKKLYQQAQELEVALPSKATALIARWDELKSTEAEIEQQLEEVKNALCLLLGPAKKGTINDRTVTWSNYAGKETVSAKDLRAKYPDIACEMVKVGKPSRRFSVK